MAINLFFVLFVVGFLIPYCFKSLGDMYKWVLRFDVWLRVLLLLAYGLSWAKSVSEILVDWSDEYDFAVVWPSVVLLVLGVGGIHACFYGVIRWLWAGIVRDARKGGQDER